MRPGLFLLAAGLSAAFSVAAGAYANDPVAEIASILETRGFYRATAAPHAADPALTLAVRAYQAAAGYSITGLTDARVLKELSATKPIYAIAISGPETSDPAEIRTLQEKLADKGLLKTSLVDGQSGPKTEEAIRSYQRQEGLPVDGIPSRDLIAKVGAD